MTGESKSFSASYDWTAKIVSAVVPALLVSVVFTTRSTIVAGVAAAILFLSYAYSPRGYAVLDRTLIVKRFIGSVRIPLDRVREARTAGANDLSACIRLFGSGGLFGWYGLFRTSKLGKCTWYVTKRSSAVVLITGAKTTLISPDDRDGFLGEIRAAVPEFTPSDPLLDAHFDA